MAAPQTLSECCISGHLHEGTPEGLTTRIVGLDAYEAWPANKSKAKTILFITDIFGWTLPNARLLADEFARAGFYVIMPDFFSGDPISTDYLNTIVPRKPDEVSAVEKVANSAATAGIFGPWLLRHREGVSRPLIDTVLNALHDDTDIVKRGAIGFCWGGRYAVLAGSGENPQVDAVVSNHPAMLSIPSEIEAIRRPVQFNIGDIDAMLDMSGVEQIKDALRKNPDLPSEVNVIPGAVHGYTVRSDMKDPDERERKERSTKDAITWFHKYLQ